MARRTGRADLAQRRLSTPRVLIKPVP